MTRQKSAKMSESRIELWMDETDTEFAIFYNSNCVIKTSDKVKFTKIIDSSVYMQGYTYDWKHTLLQWVNYKFGNQVSKNISNLYVDNPEPVIQATKRPKLIAKRIRYYSSHKNQKSVKKSKPKAKPEMLKCHFCNLKYSDKKERKEHEKSWHSEN